MVLSKIIPGWFRKSDIVIPLKERTSFRYAEIPGHNHRDLECSMQPPVSRLYEVRSLDELKNRYAEDLRRVIDPLPFSDEEKDELVLPVIANFLRSVHLLPASENHHHCYPGGLLKHSLDCAYRCLNAVQNAPCTRASSGEGNSKEQTYSEAYRNRDAWFLGAAIAGLCHDVGKVGDVKTSSDNHLEWNPNQGYLLDWLIAHKIRSYSVSWVEGRKREDHEIRSIRLMYRQILPQKTIEYLSRNCPDIIDAIDEAIVFGKGPLGTLLKYADSDSVDADAVFRKTFVSDGTKSDPRIVPILDALSIELQGSQGKTFIRSPAGLFFQASDLLAEKVRTFCSSMGFHNVPGTAAGLVDILENAGLIVTDKQGWKTVVLYRNEKAQGTFFQISNFEETLPQATSLSIDHEVTSQNPNQAVSKTEPESGRYMPSKNDFEQIVNSSLAGRIQQPGAVSEKFPQGSLPKNASLLLAGFKADITTLTEEEIAALPEKPRDVTEVRLFTERLMKTFLAQVQIGHGSLLGNRTQIGEAVDVDPLMSVMERHDISVSAARIVLSRLRSTVEIEWNADDRLLKITGGERV